MRKVPSLADVNTGIDREIGSKYDDVKYVADNMDSILELLSNYNYALKYLGAGVAPPTERQDGTPIEDGDYYLDTVKNFLVYYDLDEGVWHEIDPSIVKAYSDSAQAAMAVAVAAEAASIAAQDLAISEAAKAEAAADRAEAAELGITSIDGLSDVDTTTVAPVVDDGLFWDGTNWVPKSVEAGGITEFLMQDATDAEIETIYPASYTWNYGDYTKDGEVTVWTDENYLYSAIDSDGKAVTHEELTGSVIEVLIDGVSSYVTATMTTAGAGYFSITWPGLVTSASILVLTINVGTGVVTPLVDGDAWVRDGDSFKPKQVALKSDTLNFKMEDASDAARIHTANTPTYQWNSLDAALPDGAFIFSNTSVGFNFTDSVAAEVSSDDLIGNVFWVSFDDGPLIEVTVLYSSVGAIGMAITWDGIDAQGHAPTSSFKMYLPSQINAPDDLSNNDAWVYDSGYSKFVPKPVVPTIVVTEFPASPDANTLYIKVT